MSFSQVVTEVKANAKLNFSGISPQERIMLRKRFIQLFKANLRTMEKELAYSSAYYEAGKRFMEYKTEQRANSIKSIFGVDTKSSKRV